LLLRPDKVRTRKVFNDDVAGGTTRNSSAFQNTVDQPLHQTPVALDRVKLPAQVLGAPAGIGLLFLAARRPQSIYVAQ
jgi:hypothetical protein